MRKKISDEEADKLLEEQYIREAKEMEAGLLRSAGIDPEEESEPEAEEKIKAGYLQKSITVLSQSVCCVRIY